MAKTGYPIPRFVSLQCLKMWWVGGVGSPKRCLYLSKLRLTRQAILGLMGNLKLEIRKWAHKSFLVTLEYPLFYALIETAFRWLTWKMKSYR